MVNRSIVRSRKVMALAALVFLASCTGTQRPEQLATGEGETNDLLGSDATAAAATSTTVAASATTVSPGTSTPNASGDESTQAPATVDTAPSGPETSLPPSGPPAATIFAADHDRIGLTDDTMNICIHAALQLGAVFNNTAEDFRVYWDMVNANGGIHGRQVNVSFTDDQYTPQGGTQAAQQCKDRNAFVMGGGVGFDTVPAVRQFAEANDMLYISSFATESDVGRYQRSFTFTPSIERLGNIAGQYSASTFAGKDFGVVWRNSPNWQGGRDQFIAAIEAAGGRVVADVPVEKDQGDYTNAILTLNNAGADVVLGWVNVLEFTQLEKQAAVQNFRPTWVVAGFNLVTETLGSDIDGRNGPSAVGMWITPPYPADPGADYQEEIDRMQAAYHQFRPSKDGEVNDVDWQVWLYSLQLHKMLEDCGRDCSRNQLAGMMLAGYQAHVPPTCPIDFARGGGRLGGFAIDIYRAVPDGSSARWSSAARCREGF